MKRYVIPLLGVLLVVFSLVSVETAAPDNDLIWKRESFVIRFPSKEPNFQFYSRADENHTNYRYQLKWNQLVEFNDTNGDGLYTGGTDTKISSVPITGLSFSHEIHILNNTDSQAIGKEIVFSTEGPKENHFFLNISVAWYSETVNIPYGNQTVTVTPNEAKFSFQLTNWTFADNAHRLAFDVDLLLTTPHSQYKIQRFENGTISMLSKEDPDGKGKRGGFINNPSLVLIDGDLESINSSLDVSGVKSSFQYAFPSFNESLYYDPTYSAVSAVTASETESEDTSADRRTGIIPGLELSAFLLAVPCVVFFKKYKRRN